MTIKVTKKTVDELAELKNAYDKANKALKAAEKKLKLAQAPVVEYLEDVLKIGAKKGAELRGLKYVLEFGAKRETRVLKDPVEALRRLEAVRQGLGFEHISIPLKVLDEELRADEITDLIGFTYGARSMKATNIDD